MTNSINASRRALLRHVSALSALGVGMPLALNLAAIGAAAAQTAPGAIKDYKAVVCLFLAGGNDAHNTVLATDPTSLASYNLHRGSGTPQSIALNPAAMLPITPATPQSGRSFALHPNLGPLRDLFNQGRLGIVANVGTLLVPISKAQFSSTPQPPALLSHNDQSVQWQCRQGIAGWGNRMGELLMSANGTELMTCISHGGNSTFLAGDRPPQVQINSNGMTPLSAPLLANLFGSTTAPASIRDLLTRSRTEPFAASQTAVVNRLIEAQALFQRSLLPAGAGGVANPPAGSGLGAVLQNIARVIGGHTIANVRRQVFFAAIGGFDNHDKLLVNHGALMTQLAVALQYFDDVLGALNMRDNVTLFTASEFGRTLANNGSGSDHGWGGHHFVMGGAVKGGDIYGRYPILGSDTPDDFGQGRLLPAVSVDQMGSTIARWFGLSESQLDDVFPYLRNFGSSRNLGFMKV